MVGLWCIYDACEVVGSRIGAGCLAAQLGICVLVMDA